MPFLTAWVIVSLTPLASTRRSARRLGSFARDRTCRSVPLDFSCPWMAPPVSRSMMACAGRAHTAMLASRAKASPFCVRTRAPRAAVTGLVGTSLACLTAPRSNRRVHRFEMACQARGCRGRSAMARRDVLSVQVPPVEERRRKIEAEPLPANIGAVLDEAAADAPNQIAWNFFESGETISYLALVARVNQLANGMAMAGIGKGTHVAVMLPNIAAFPTTWLAVARLGAVMIPLNIAYTAREMQYVVENGDAEYLIIHNEHLATLSELNREQQHIAPDKVFVVGRVPSGFKAWQSL